MGNLPDAAGMAECDSDLVKRSDPHQQEIKPMSFLSKFRPGRRNDYVVDDAELKRIRKIGPLDRPADIRNKHTLVRSMGGW